MVAKKQKDKSAQDEDANVLSAFLAEYNSMRDEILQIQTSINQLVLYALLSVGVAIPIMASLLQNQLWVSLLIAPLVFSSMAWAYTGYIGMSYRISIYIHTQIRPCIQSLVEKKHPQYNKIFNWENFARSSGLNILAVPKGFEILLFIFPSIGCVILYFGIQSVVGFKIPAVDWVLLGIDFTLTFGVIVMAFIIMRLGYSKLSLNDKEKEAGVSGLESHPAPIFEETVMKEKIT